MKNLLFSICAFLFTTSLFAQDEAFLRRLEESPRHHEWIKTKHGDREVHSFLVFPEVKEKVMAVIVIHENRGLNDWARGMADQIAEAGYIAIAPDLLSGSGPDGGKTADFANSDAARTAIYDLDPDQVTGDLNAVYEFVKTLDATNGKVAVIGFCWGGSQTFRYVTNNSELDAAFVCYGGAPKDATSFSKINTPIYGFYGGNDARVNAGIPATEKNMKENGKFYEPVIYDGAGHGFFRAGEMKNASEENAKAREEGLKRLKKLLDTVNE
ncbi:MAG: dienelactone hydrolase family protein [Cyclobacteriaceae bacterium]|nr:dienelactone hydrolase family protein [Cyclobacteriaceae bacterium]